MVVENHSIADLKTVNKDVFLKLEYVNKEQSCIDELLSEIKKDVSEVANFIALYVYRSNGSYVVIGRFRSQPNFSSSVAAKIWITVLTQKELELLSQKQLYTIDEQGRLTLIPTFPKYGPNFYFSQRKSKQHDNLIILNVFNPNEYVAQLDFDINNAMFSFDESINGELFYILDELSRDIRVSINEQCELAFNATEELTEIKNFRDYVVNDMVLIKNGGYVRRGCVLSCTNNICEVLCVDYGIKLRCSFNQLRVAPPHIAYIRFLAIPCVLNGIGTSEAKNVRQYVNELIHHLDRCDSELIVQGKDENSLQQTDILFKDKVKNEKISVAKYLKESGLIKNLELSRQNCKYDFSEMLKLIVGASQVSLLDDSSIQRPFMQPSEFLATNSVAKKLVVQK